MEENTVRQAYGARFGRPEVVVRAPARINLIGEHTDYNEGFVLPAAVHYTLWLAIGSGTGPSRALALDFGEEADISPTARAGDRQPGWARYLQGSLALLRQQGHRVGEVQVVAGGNIPVGAGLSSSAALTAGFLFGLNELFGLNIDRTGLARLARQVENEYAGVQCGIMDPFAILHGAKGQALYLDCRSLAYELTTMSFSGYEWVLVDTGVKHSLAASAYNTRRRECEQGVQVLQRHRPHIRALRDATLADVEEAAAEMPGQVYRRCRFVVEENARVEQAVQAGARDEAATMGRLLLASHAGLRHLYEVSCAELDFLVGRAQTLPGIAGARMMGGGFGGCTLHLMATAQAEKAIDRLRKAYRGQFGRLPAVYRPQLAEGVSLLA